MYYCREMRYEHNDKRRSPLVTVCLAFLLCSTPLSAQEAAPQEAAPTIFNIPLGSNEVTLSFKGYWKGNGSLLGGLGISLDGSSPWALSWQSPGAPLLFAQELDLDVFLEINRQWFLETCFSDTAALEEYRMGYRGKEHETLEYVVLGNSGLEYPALPFSNLGGDTPSSIGGYTRLGTGAVKVHALARYDNSARKEKTWTGSRESSYSLVSPLERERGMAFVLSQTDISGDVTVWLEDGESGTIEVVDASGTARFRRAVLGEYALSKEEGLLELADAPEGRVLVHWSGLTAPVYTDPFLQPVRQAFLDASEGSIDISALPLPGGGAPATIEGLPSLVLYEKGTFSPWEVQNRYRGPLGATEAVLIEAANGKVQDGYAVRALADSRETDEQTAFTEDDTGRWILLAGSASRNRRSVEERWPLLEAAPQLYLPAARIDDSGLRLRFLTEGPESAYYIGTDAIAQTVRVYRNGVEDALAVFDPDTGIVTLSSPVRENERVRISWAKATEEAAYGSLALGLGLVKEETADDPVGWGSALFFRWSLLENAWASAGSQYPGALGASAWARYKTEQLLISAAASISHSQNDTSGLYRIDGFGEEVFTLWPASFETTRPGPSSELGGLPESERQPLVFRDYSYTDFFGTSLGNFSRGAPVESGEEGPYPVMDSSMGGAVLAAEFSLKNQWAGWQIDITELSDLFARAGTISLPLYFRNLTGSGGVRVSLQAGALSQPEDWLIEQPDLVWTQTLAYATVGAAPANWQLVSLSLEEEDRAALAACRALRIVIQAMDTSPELSGILVTGPIQIEGSLHSRWRLPAGAAAEPVLAEAASSGYTASKPDPGLAASWPERINRVSLDEANRVLDWQLDSLASDEGTAIAKRYAALPLEDYEALSILVKADSEDPLAGLFELAIADTAAEALSTTATPALKLSLPLKEFTAGSWQLLRVSLVDGTVTLDGNLLSPAVFARNPAKDSGESAVVAISLRPNGESLPTDLVLSIDELSLEESRGWWAALGALDYDQKIPGAILSKGETVLLSDYTGSATLRGSLPFDEASRARLQSRGDFSIGILGAKAHAGGAFTLEQDEFTRALTHRIEIPLGPLAWKDELSYEPDENASASARSLSVSGPLNAVFTQTAVRERAGLTQEYRLTGSAGTPYQLVTPPAPASSGQETTPPTDKTAATSNPAGLSLFAGVEAAARWDSVDSPLEPQFRSWPEAIADSYFDLVPIEGSQSAARSFFAKLTLSGGFPGAGLILHAEVSGDYDRSLQQKVDSGLYSLSVPWSVFSEIFTLTLSRSLLSRAPNDSQSSLEDLQFLADFFGAGADLYTAIPAYSLFEAAHSDRFSLFGAGSVETLWRDRLALDWGPARRTGLRALFLPSKAAFALERESASQLESMDDTLRLSLSALTAAVNLFGDFGTHRLTGLFTSDQYSQILSLEVPVGGSAPLGDWELNTRHTASFLRKGAGTLGVSNSLTINADGFREVFSGSLTRNTAKSPSRWLFVRITPLLSRLLNGEYLKNLHEAPLKTEAVEQAAFNMEQGVNDSWQFTFSHEDRVSAGKLAVLSLIASLGVGQTEVAAAISLNASATISFTLRF